MPSNIDLSQYPETVEFFGGNEQRAKVFLDRYAMKDSAGVPIERTPDEMWPRVADAIGDDPTQRARFWNLLRDFKFVPGGRILAGAGIEAEVTFYNCYVIPVETKTRRQNRAAPWQDKSLTAYVTGEDTGNDSREAILDTISVMVDIMSRGGGVGINWSVLRPKGAYLKRVHGTTSGPVSWMDVASRAVGVVEQGGSRRGAAMFMLDDWHPDIEEFIDAKRDFSLITNANVSVAVSDRFMEAVKNDGTWTLCFPDTRHPAYNTEWDGDLDDWYRKYGPDALVEYRTVRARDLWRKMAEAAWASGEPGVVFLDRYNKLSTVRYGEEGVYPAERIICVNPCGEQGLGPYSVCNLGAMNLAAYVKSARRSGKPGFDWSAFTGDVADATEFLDNVIDKNFYFLPENEAIQKQLRRIGLGVMGLADALIALGIRYGSPEAVEFTERVFRTMKQSAVSRSAFLAQQKGAAPAWHPNMLRSPYLAEFADTAVGRQMARHGLRNLFLLTQAPTGSTSILTGVNSGIEPYFAFEYTRKDRTGTHVVRVAALDEWYRTRKLSKDGDDLPDYFVTSNEVTVEEHIAMQAAVQKYVDSSVSKTINGPNSHTVEDVERAYTLAYEQGLKGLAYFRDGSGRDQVLYKDAPKPEVFRHIDWCQSTGPFGAKDCDCPETEREEILLAKYEELVQSLAPHAVEFERPVTLTGTTTKVRTAAGTAYVTINRDLSGKPVEVFVNVGKAGSDIMELGEAIGRLASLALRNGASLGGVANQLEGIGGNGRFNKPLAHAIGGVLTHMNNLFEFEKSEPILIVEDDDEDIEAPEAVLPTKPTLVKASQRNSGQLCPECQNFSVALEEGCKKCMSCGWSAC